MKIIKLNTSDQELIEAALKNKRSAQKKIFDRYAPKMLAVCRRYISDSYLAEEVMLQSFMKVFTNLENFEHKGSFEGWIRRITVNNCISYLRKKEKLVYTDSFVDLEVEEEETFEEFEMEYLQKIIDELPEGYKTVFMLYAMEDYKHKEISEMLGISESTSKSQLFKARKTLKSKLQTLKTKSYETR
ncbi:RNA polymerase sigma factor [Aureivirga sp. CE67]|uniref:RNA polymerase sigma factor n=1 Tax=Aureivirga sp. CE67 TaxID=1788983 RepID=UPI0018C9C6C7|nr:RNA polymerase sigma factor [Aureivirga sp. CE67]